MTLRDDERAMSRCFGSAERAEATWRRSPTAALLSEAVVDAVAQMVRHAVLTREMRAAGLALQE